MTCIRQLRWLLRGVFVLSALTAGSLPAWSGGPKWVAGTSYFNPAVKGQPIVWAGGVVRYYTDQGSLSATVNNGAANNLVANSVYAWNQVPTSSVVISAGGTLGENVSGANVFQGSGGIVYPADVESTAKPVAVIYDQDGTVTELVAGPGSSAPSNCQQAGVTTVVDGMSVDGYLNHAIVILNGRCAAGAGAALTTQLAQMQYELERAFGRVLGLDWSQTNDNAFTTVPQPTVYDYDGWPIMHPIEIDCGTAYSYQCVPNPSQLRMDERAALRRLYPVTAANLGSLPGKQLTAPNTVRIYGWVRFRNGQGMQGVNVVARQLAYGSQQVDSRYAASAVSGVLFRGHAGNPVTGSVDSQGKDLGKFGSDDEELEGFYDLGGLDTAGYGKRVNYVLTLEPVNPLYTQKYSVGPYTTGSPAPSGTMPTATLYVLFGGANIEQDFEIPDSAGDGHSGADGTEAAPAEVATGGVWTGRISGYGHTAWFGTRVRANRTLTLEATALDEGMLPTYQKAFPLLGAWSGTDALGSLPGAATPQSFNGREIGQTQLNFSTGQTGQIRLAITDQRGDGRPDYAYHGRLLYADAITPARLGLGGGTVTISGTGFQGNSQVLVDGVVVTPVSVTPNRIVLSAPAVATGGDGAVDVQVTDPTTRAESTMSAALTYGVVSGDRLLALSAPAGLLSMGVPSSTGFAVRAVAANGVTPLAGVAVTFSVALGNASFGACGAATCTVLTGQDGVAQTAVTPLAAGALGLTAGLANGATVAASVTVSGAASDLLPLVGQFEVAAGNTVSATVGVVDMAAGVPLANQAVSWTATDPLVRIMGPAVSMTNSSGVATVGVQIQPLTAGGSAQVSGCSVLSVCATITAVGAAAARLAAVSGAGQSIPANGKLAPLVLRVSSGDGSPLMGGKVVVSQTLRGWTRGCGFGIAGAERAGVKSARGTAQAGAEEANAAATFGAVGRCGIQRIMRSNVSPLISDADGLVSLQPLQMTGIPAELSVMAVAGAGITLTTVLEMHP